MLVSIRLPPQAAVKIYLYRNKNRVKRWLSLLNFLLVLHNTKHKCVEVKNGITNALQRFLEKGPVQYHLYKNSHYCYYIIPKTKPVHLSRAALYTKMAEKGTRRAGPSPCWRTTTAPRWSKTIYKRMGFLKLLLKRPWLQIVQVMSHWCIVMSLPQH